MIKEHLDLMKAKVKAGDIFVFYVFSHGMEGKMWSSNTYFDGFRTSSNNGYYKIEDLRDDFNEIGRKEALVISVLDTCGSGYMAQKGKSAANTAWITATSGTQYGYYIRSGSSYSGWEYGLFGRAFLDWGWNSGMAGKSGRATYYDLYEYAASRVQGIAFDSKQNPDVVHGNLIKNVRAYNGIAKSSQSVPAKPSQVVVNGSGLSSLSVSWQSVANASYYTVKCRKSGETKWKWFFNARFQYQFAL